MGDGIKVDEVLKYWRCMFIWFFLIIKIDGVGFFLCLFYFVCSVVVVVVYWCGSKGYVFIIFMISFFVDY